MIIDAALQLYLRDGIGAITMEALAAEADVTKPVVYSCFANRDAVLDALMDTLELTVAEHTSQAIAAAKRAATVEEASIAGIATMLRAAKSEPDAYRASVLFEQGATAELSARVRTANAARIAAMAEELQRWTAQRGAPASLAATRLFAHTVVQMLRGYIILILRDDPGASIDRIAVVATRGLSAIADELGIDAAPAPDGAAQMLERP